MKIRTAILRAADKIESDPASYQFSSNRKPGRGIAGCFMGWIGSFLGIREAGSNYPWQVERVCGFGFCDIGSFAFATDWYWRSDCSYQTDAATVARVLREFAAARFPEAPIKPLAHQPVPAQGEA